MCGIYSHESEWHEKKSHHSVIHRVSQTRLLFVSRFFVLVCLDRFCDTGGVWPNRNTRRLGSENGLNVYNTVQTVTATQQVVNRKFRCPFCVQIQLSVNFTCFLLSFEKLCGTVCIMAFGLLWIISNSMKADLWAYGALSAATAEKRQKYYTWLGMGII